MDGLADITRPDNLRGWPFLMALAEYPDPASAAHASAQAVKAWVGAKLRELTGQLPAVTRQAVVVVADQLALVVEGIHASTAALGTDGSAQHARSLAALVIDAATGHLSLHPHRSRSSAGTRYLRTAHDLCSCAAVSSL